MPNSIRRPTASVGSCDWGMPGCADLVHVCEVDGIGVGKSGLLGAWVLDGDGMLSQWALAFRNLFLPMFCRACGQRLLTEENGFFCPTCWEMSARVSRPFCSVCGRPHQGTVGFGFPTNFPCAECRRKGPSPLRRTYGAALYEDAIEEAIKLFKFNGRQRLAKPLGALMAAFALAEMDVAAYDSVVPVPLHKVRERDRGFNQSRLLALEILPVFPNAVFDESLKRIRPTRIQSRSTGQSERRANVAGAFAVEGDLLTGKTVLLIDDVVTTGVTTSECAVALRRAGVCAVDVFAPALVSSHPTV